MTVRLDTVRHSMAFVAAMLFTAVFVAASMAPVAVV